MNGHSRADGEVHMVGPLRRPRELQFTANLDNLDADVEDVKIKNQGPIRFSMAEQTLQIDQFHLVGEDTDISATGKVRLSGDRELDLRAQGRVNLKLIESLNPDFTSSGVVSVDLSVGGTVAKPLTQGQLKVDHGAIAYIDLPSALSDINGSLIFNQDRLQVQSLTAHTGGGLVTFGGYATAYNGKLNFDLTVRGEDVRLRYPPGVSATANADLHFAGTSSASTLNGEIIVTKLAMTPGFDFGAYLERSQASALPPTNRLLNRIRLDVHIATTPELQMQTASLRLSGDADLHLRGTAGKPVILGRADIIEGEVQFNGTKYRLERGDITFINPVTTTPVLDLQASTRVRDGERFLVSLALALALSGLEGRSSFVDTLFIDEGFGSLDAETLDLAVDALETLQGRGQKVGVITHVAAMIERIAVQVRVEKRGAGRSEIRVSDGMGAARPVTSSAQ